MWRLFAVIIGLTGMIVLPLKAADTSLSNLNAGNAVSGTDLFYDVQTPGVGGVKVTGSQLKSFITLAPSFSGNVTFSSITGSTQCLQVNGSGVAQGTGALCGGSAAVTSVTSADGTVNINPTTGTVLVSLGLAHANIWTASQTFNGGLTGTTGAFTTSLTSPTGTFQTVTVNSLTPGGPNCLQETGGVIQATNAACSSGSISGTGVSGQVALWNAATVLTGDVGITFTSPGQLALNMGNLSATTAFNTNPRAISIVATWNSTGAAFDAPLFMNITTSGFASPSMLADLKVGGITQFAVFPSGSIAAGVGAGTVFSPFEFRAAGPIGNKGLINIVDKAHLANDPSNGAAVSGFGSDVGAGSTGRVWYFGPDGGATQLDLLYSQNGPVVLFTNAAESLRVSSQKTIISDGVTATGLNIYNTVDSAAAPTNFERGIVDWTTTTNVFTIGTQNGGTGTARNIKFVVGGGHVLDYGITNGGSWSFSDASGAINNGTIFSGTYRVAFDSGGTQTSAVLDVSGPRLRMGSGGLLQWTATANDFSGTLDTGISRIAAGTLGIGNGTAADTSGTLNLANENMTPTASLAALSIGLGTITTNTKAISINATWQSSGITYDAPLFMNITNVTQSAAGSFFVDIQSSGITQFGVLRGGGGIAPGRVQDIAWLANGTNPGTNLYIGNANSNSIGFQLAHVYWYMDAAFQNLVGPNAGGLGFTGTNFYDSASINNNNVVDTLFYRDAAAGVFGISNQKTPTAATGLRIYNTVDNTQGVAPTNYERGIIDWTTTSNVFTIGTQNGGTGSARALTLLSNNKFANWDVNGTLSLASTAAGAAAGAQLFLGTNSGGYIRITSNGFLGFVSGTDANQAADTSVSRNVAKVLQFGDGGANINGWYNWTGEARVTSDVTYTSTTTLGVITGLSVTLAANRTYSFVAELPWTDASAGGLQLAVTGTVGPTNIIYDGYIVDSAFNGIKGSAQATSLGGVVASSTTTGTAGHARIAGTITVNTAGTLFVQAAQNTSSGTPTTIKRGATFIVQDMP